MIPNSDYLKFNNFTIRYDKMVYKPREDTFLIMDHLNLVIKKSSFCIDVGIGSGILSISIADTYPTSTIIGIDLNINACSISLENINYNEIDNILIVCGEGLRSFRNNINYDFVISNPPYLPSNPDYDQYLSKNELIQFVGGELGIEFTEGLMKDALRLSKEYYVIISSETMTIAQFKNNHKTLTIIELAKIKLDFEILWFVKIQED